MSVSEDLKQVLMPLVDHMYSDMIVHIADNHIWNYGSYAQHEWRREDGAELLAELTEVYRNEVRKHLLDATEFEYVDVDGEHFQKLLHGYAHWRLWYSVAGAPDDYRECDFDEAWDEFIEMFVSD